MKQKNNRYTYINYLRSQRAFIQTLKPQILKLTSNNVCLNEQEVDLEPQLNNLEDINIQLTNEKVNIQDIVTLEEEINVKDNNQNQNLNEEILATTLINEQASGINEISEQKETTIANKKHKKQTMAFKAANSRKNFDFEKFEKNVKYKSFKDGTVKKIAAEIENVRLTFTNPSKPNDRALVLRNTSVQFYEGEVHAIIGESGSGKSVITSLLYGLAGKNANVEEGKILLYNNEVQDFSFKD